MILTAQQNDYCAIPTLLSWGSNDLSDERMVFEGTAHAVAQDAHGLVARDRRVGRGRGGRR